MQRLKFYLKIWWLMSKNSFLVVLANKAILLIFLFGKVLRFGFFILFLFFLVNGAQGVAGYTVNQMIFFFLTFNLVDVTSQFLFREVYRFRPLIISGDFDLVLAKPVSALFRVLFGGADVIDLFTLPPLIIAVIYFGGLLNPTFLASLFFSFLILNGLFIATAFHIFVVSMGIITLEIDHTIMVYRDLTSLARFPTDIYKEPVRGILTYLVPVSLMISLPAKALFGLVSLQGVVLTFFFACLLFFLALKFWHYAVKRYQSASS